MRIQTSDITHEDNGKKEHDSCEQIKIPTLELRKTQKHHKRLH